MLKGRPVLAVIPARGGSKRFPGKNLASYRGKSLLSLAFEVALASRYIDRIVVSTEDHEIKQAALALKMEVIDRPVELAADNTSSEDVLRHAIGCVPGYDWIVLLQATSPLRTREDIDTCIEACLYANACRTVCKGIPNGAVYAALSGWLAHNDFSGYGVVGLETPEERSLDIDYEEQLC